MAKLTNKVARWMDAKLMRDPALSRRVAARMNELRLEEELLGLREVRGLTQAQLAELVGVTQPVIARWESGQVKNMHLETLLRLTTALGGDLHVAIRSPRHTGSPGARPPARDGVRSARSRVRSVPGRPSRPPKGLARGA